MNENLTKRIHPVDEMLPAGRLFAYGLQHVLAMYAGACTCRRLNWST